MDPAIAYGIVFSNFMKKGIYTFKDGTDSLIKKMVSELRQNGAELRRQSMVESLITYEKDGKHHVSGVMVNGKKIRCKAVLSNANLKSTIEKLLGLSKLPSQFAKSASSVRLNSTSSWLHRSQGWIAFPMSDLIFALESTAFSSEELTDFHTMIVLFPFTTRTRDLTEKTQNAASSHQSTPSGRIGTNSIRTNMPKKKKGSSKRAWLRWRKLSRTSVKT